MTSEILAWQIRRHALELTHRTGASHVGAILSCADILAVLYADILHIRPREPQWEDRDRFVLSKGHASLGLYGVLAEMGFFGRELLREFYRDGNILLGHASHHVPGVEFSSGSLGHGLGAAVGMALGAKLDGKAWRAYALLGDGECNEGSVWEAVQAGAFFGLENLTVIVDHNHLQSLGRCEDTLLTGTLAEKWASFGWQVTEVDGHDQEALRAVLRKKTTGRPSVIIAHTVKGKGIPFMEDQVLWHYRFPHSGGEYEQGLAALNDLRPAGVVDPYLPEESL